MLAVPRAHCRARRALALALPLALAACSKDLLPSYELALAVVGNPAPITVTLEWPGGTDSVTIAADGRGAFDSELAVGTGAVLRAPAECRFRNADATLAITTTNVATELPLACPGVLELTSLGLSAPYAVSRDGASYTVGVPALTAATSPLVTVAPTPRYVGLELLVNDLGQGKGDAVADRLGATNRLDVTYPDHLLRQRYTIALRRETTAKQRQRTPGATANASFGFALSGDGQRVAVGEPGVSFGRVSIYRLLTTPTGPTWQLEDTVEPGAAAGSASGFGEALALVGDRLVIGAPRDGNTDVGAVYVYERQGSDWNLVVRHSYELPGSRFGAAVALSSTGLLVVGAPGEAGGGANAGAAYLFPDARNATSSPVSATHRNANDEFGAAVAIFGSNVLIAAPGDDSDAPSSAPPPASDNANRTDAGAVYVFAATGGLATRYLKQAAPTNGSRFGSHLAAHGGAAAIARTGGVDCYGTTWSSRGTITIGDTVSALTLETDRVAVAHPVAGSGGALRVSAYRLATDASTPATLAPAFLGDQVADGDGFGKSLAFAGDALHVGAPQQGGTGALYVFE